VVPNVDFTSHVFSIVGGCPTKSGYLHRIRVVNEGQDNHFSFLHSLIHGT
jgi:hypothetical protein